MRQKDMEQLESKISRLYTVCDMRVCSNPLAGFSSAIKHLEGLSGRKWIFLLSFEFSLKRQLFW